jgi:hypothetical protein
LAGVEEQIVNSQYLVVLIISLVFTVLTIFRRTIVLDGFSSMCWFICGGVHLVSSPSTSPLFSISYLWLGFGFVFLILLFKDVWKFYDFRKTRKGTINWMDDEEL